MSNSKYQNAIDRFYSYSSEFENFTLTEEYDKKALEIIIKNFDQLYDSGHIGKFKNAQKGYTQISDKNTVRTILQNLLKRNNLMNYRYCNEKIGGRRFATTTSLQMVNKIIRHTVCQGDLYIDLDIVNCHPIFLQFLCSEMELQTPCLDDYIENREEKLSLLMSKFGFSRDDAKDIFLKALNGGMCNEVLKVQENPPPTWFVNFYDEMKLIRAEITEKNPDIKKTCKDYNKDGSCTNKVLTIIEDNVLKVLSDCARNLGLEIGVFCFDGLMIYKRSVKNPIEEIIQQMEKSVLDVFGLKVSITEKPMLKGLDLSKYQEENESVEKEQESKQKRKEDIKAEKEKKKRYYLL